MKNVFSIGKNGSICEVMAFNEQLGTAPLGYIKQLLKGHPKSLKQAKELYSAHCQKIALVYSYKWLGMKDLSSKELEDKLAIKGFLKPFISYAVNKCQSLGYIDDEKLMRRVIEKYLIQGYGPYKIRQKLKMKSIDAFLDIAYDKQLKAANIALDKKYAGAIAKDVKLKAKQMRFLQSRGFSKEVILELLNP